MSKIKEYVDVEKEDGLYAYSTKPVSEFIGMEEADEKLVTFAFVQSVIKNVSGQVFTILDASISDKEQKKAIKDLFRNVISREYEHISNFVYNQEKMCDIANKHFQEAEDRGEKIESVDLVDELLKD